MRTRAFIVVASCLLAVLTACGGRKSPSTYVYVAYEADSGRSVTMRAGDELRVILAENRSTGYLWSVVTNDEDVLAQDGDPSYVVKGNAIGAGGEATFTFRAAGPGTSALLMINARPSSTEAVTPDRTFTLSVDVIE